MSYELSSSNSDCYSGTSVLINKKNIRNQEQLATTETLIVSVKSVELELKPLPQTLDFAYYCYLHQTLFDALYEWAGQPRTINLSKMQTVFCPAEEICPLATRIFSRVEQSKYFTDMPHDQLVQEFAELYQSLNYLHPFREGNGRVQRLYFRRLAAFIGYQLDFSLVDSDSMMIATIQAANGVLSNLLSIFHEILKK